MVGVQCRLLLMLVHWVPGASLTYTIYADVIARISTCDTSKRAFCGVLYNPGCRHFSKRAWQGGWACRQRAARQQGCQQPGSWKARVVTTGPSPASPGGPGSHIRRWS
eukprot:scaffold29145_cov21-Tisochrysis_lutea.AAC.1